MPEYQKKFRSADLDESVAPQEAPTPEPIVDKPKPAPKKVELPPLSPEETLLERMNAEGHKPTGDVHPGIPGDPSAPGFHCHADGRLYSLIDGVVHRVGGLVQSVKGERWVEGEWQRTDGLHWYRAVGKGFVQV